MNQLNTFKITLESKDHHLYEYTCHAIDRDIAIQKVFQNISENGWDIYEYQVKYIDEIDYAFTN